MEKRFVLFLVLSMAVLMGYAMVRALVAPPPPAADQVEQLPDADKAEPQQEVDLAEAAPAAETGTGLPEAADSAAADAPPGDPGPAIESEPADVEQQWISLGSYDPQDNSPLLVTVTNRGALVARIELTARTPGGKLRYRNLDDNSGYLGHLELTEVDSGCRVNVVGRGTPADLAKPDSGATAPGLQLGDVIQLFNGTPVSTPDSLEDLLRATKPKETIVLTVARLGGETEQAITFNVTLGVRPLQMIRPEPLADEESRRADGLPAAHPLSYRLALTQIGNAKARPDQVELTNVPSLRTATWRMREITDPTPGVEFRLVIDPAQTPLDGMSGPIEVVKRFRLGAVDDMQAAESLLPYHLNFDLEFHNQGDRPLDVAYRLDGPNGLPTEGWWFSNKIHPVMFQSAGARDVIWQTDANLALKYRYLGCSAIFKNAQKDKREKNILFTKGAEDVLDRTLRYVAVDTQYFLAALIPRDGEGLYDWATAEPLNDLEKMAKGRIRSTNVSFGMVSPTATVEPGAPLERRFTVFAGPKDPQLLGVYGLEDAIYYGWFGSISRVLSAVLHFFYSLIRNYGVAIILLTVLVRSCMFPLSRKAAKNAAMMQALAPEMRKIAEKYKNDMEKRAKAQQDLFKKHNYNPFGGCWMMFLQLPIFIGLYRCLSVDIELRQAALIPGITWCSNLAGPDKLFYWRNSFLGLFTETGMLGPYFNILPLFTVALFLVHQKLFTPPATDEQTKMQMQMMKYMTLFIGVMFFKVAAGLCLYFIASSLWGIAERQLIPKPKPPSTDEPAAGRGKEPRPSPGNGNGPGRKSPSRSKKRQRRR